MSNDDSDDEYDYEDNKDAMDKEEEEEEVVYTAAEYKQVRFCNRVEHEGRTRGWLK